MEGKRLSGIIFALSILGGLGIAAVQSVPLVFFIVILETAFVIQMPCCRNFEPVWEFVLFFGTMFPVHVLWFYPAVICSADNPIELEAFQKAYIFLFTCSVFSAEMILVLLFVRKIVKMKKKARRQKNQKNRI